MVTNTVNPNTTTVRITYETKKQLDLLGAKNDSYDDIIKRLIEFYTCTVSHK